MKRIRTSAPPGLKLLYQDMLNSLAPHNSVVVDRRIIQKFGWVKAGVLSVYLNLSLRRGRHFWMCPLLDKITNELRIEKYIVLRVKNELIKDGILESRILGKANTQWLRINIRKLYKILLGPIMYKYVKGSPLLRLGDFSGDHIYIYNIDKNNNKNNNNINNKNRYMVTTKDLDNAVKVPTKVPTKVPIAERNKTYIPQARKLSQIIKKFKNIKFSISQLRAWTNPIRQMVEQNKISIKRIDASLKWYAKNCKKPYVPIIESGYTLRSKFISLEAAISRAKVTTAGSKKSPDKIIEKRLNKSEVGRMKDVFKDVLDSTPDIDLVLLAESLCTLHDHIVKVRPEDALTQTDHSEDIGTPVYLIEEFVYWMDNESWIDNILLSAFNSESKMWKRFLKFQEDKIGLNPMTGNY